jgi:adenylate kinase family enzyme
VDRIRLDTGGDRKVRVDDSLQQIKRKLQIFRLETAPLLDHYRRKGVRILPIRVGLNTTAKDMLEAVDKQGWK